MTASPAQPSVRLEADQLLLPLADLSAPYSLPMARFLAELVAQDYPELRRVTFDLDTKKRDRLPGLGRVECHWSDSTTGAEDCFLRLGDGTPALCAVQVDGTMQIDVAGHKRATLLSHLVRLRDELEREQEQDEASVAVSFWNASDGYGSRRTRRLSVPLFAEIAANYAEPTRSSLSELMQIRPAESMRGRLLLWHGEPGTGKTWALRALIREWREWAEVNYIVDPEAVLAPGSSYMLQVLTSGEGERWKLLVLEDAGELLAIDARMQVGQAFARLLNLTDGLLGQGMRTLVLVTTNERLGKLHPAVTRPGRALSEIEFKRFSEDEAAEWLRSRGREIPAPPRSQTLAELFASGEWAYGVPAGHPVRRTR